MKKRIRQYIGLLLAVLAYYAVHEGAHLIYALSTGVFRQINFMGIGMQIGIYEEQMSDTGAYDFKKAQELLETDVETGLKIRYEEVQNSELDDLWNGMCWGADPVHLHDHDPAVQKSGLVDSRLPQGHSGEVF